MNKNNELICYAPMPFERAYRARLLALRNVRSFGVELARAQRHAAASFRRVI
jgi:hypothetical protein